MPRAKKWTVDSSRVWTLFVAGCSVTKKLSLFLSFGSCFPLVESQERDRVSSVCQTRKMKVHGSLHTIFGVQEWAPSYYDLLMKATSREIGKHCCANPGHQTSSFQIQWRQMCDAHNILQVEMTRPSMKLGCLMT